jgi:Tat protein translocase TatC
MVTLDDPAARAAYEDERSLPRMSFGDHLDELRRRLLVSLLAVIAAILGMLPFKKEVGDIVIAPYRVIWLRGYADHTAALEAKEKAGSLTDIDVDFLGFCRKHAGAILDGSFEPPHVLPTRTGYQLPYTLMATGGLEDIWTFFMASLIFALVVSAPIVVWQAWAFVAAGLYPRERKVFHRYFPFMVVLFAAGVYFGYRLALPYSLGFLIRMMDPNQVGAMLTVGQYFTLLFGMTAAMGVVFELPLVMVALQRVGLVRHQTYVKNWRMIVLLIFLGAAVFTPPDPFSMMLMSGPMLVLYVLGLALTRLGRRHEHPFDALSVP